MSPSVPHASRRSLRRLASAPSADSPALRIAIVAERDSEGVPLAWQESVVDAAGGRTVVQSLVPASVEPALLGDGRDATPAITLPGPRHS
jgi:hypothetical protein